MNATLAWGHGLTWPELLGPDAALHLEVPPAERRGIARELQLEGLSALSADLVLRPWLDGVEVKGRLKAVAQRLCGLSLEPFDEVIDEALEIRIVPRGSPNASREEGGEIFIDPEAEDPPDEAQGPSVDLSAYVREAFALALDPFPRKPGAVFVAPDPGAPLSPFAVLAQLNRTPKSE